MVSLLGLLPFAPIIQCALVVLSWSFSAYNVLMEIKNTCANCTFFSGKPQSECRRYPNYVKKRKEDWCGEFVEITSAKIKERQNQAPKKEKAFLRWFK